MKTCFLRRARAGRILQPLVIQDKPSGDIFAQSLGGPLAELHATLRLDPVTQGDDRIQSVAFRLVILSISSSCKEFLYH